ncbi:MAG: S8 family serine peptidase [Kamptonema sp. SIO1D9]|nr:S8 family serine peptidase [Kamptonema sp. SIO1D9]
MERQYSRIVLGKDRVDGDDNPLLEPGEGNEHGTHVLGIIAAEQDNGIGIDGINDDAPLWVGRAIGSGKWAESLVEFVDAARDSGQPNAVINLSLDLTQINPDGSVTTRYEFTPLEMAALEYARQNNVLVVTAAGNDGGVMSALGQASQQFDNIITVGAAEQIDGETSAWKGFDRAAYSSYGNGLDIVADGGTLENPVMSTVGDGVGAMDGTSVATAKVTGAVSQVWAANPELSYRQVIDLLKSTATDLKTANADLETGSGLLNMVAAVLLAKATKPEEAVAQDLQFISLTWSGEGLVTPIERAADPTSSITGTHQSDGNPEQPITLQSFLNIFGAYSSPNWLSFLRNTFDKFYSPQSQKPTNGKNQLIFYDRESGDNEFYQVNNGSMTLTRRGSGWRKTWDLIIPGDFDGDGKTNLLFYDRESGDYEFYQVNNGSMTLTRRGSGWRKTWDLIIPGDFDGDGKTNLLFYDRESGDYEFYQVNNGSMTLTRRGSGWRKTWDLIIPGDFDGDGKTNLLFYDRESGDYEFYRVNNNKPMTPIRKGSGWRKTWDLIIPGDFDGDGKTNLLFYDRESGDYEFYQVNSNKPMTPTLRGSGWRKTWDLIIPDAPEVKPVDESSNYLQELTSWTDWQWEDSINSASDLNDIKNNQNSDIGKLYRDLSNDLFGQYFPPSGAYISDDYKNATGLNSYHGAIDIGGSINNHPVKSLVNGTVVLSTYHFGTLTILGEDGRYYIYKHLSSRSFTQGQMVTKGQVVGRVGGVGANGIPQFFPHLHFEVSKPPYTYGAAHSPSVLHSKAEIRQRNYNPVKAYWELRRR